MDAVIVDNVSKQFRKHRRKRFLTIKSTMIELLKKKTDREKAKFLALNQLSFNIKKGEMVGIIGRNGSGKSTLLKVVAGITKPTTGKVTINGRLSALIELGGGFHPEISGRENIMINGIILGLSKKYLQSKIDDIIAFSGLEDFIDAPVRTYSSGMFIRLGFSIAIHVNPEILLIDEILAVGDAKFGRKCIDKIEEYKDRGKTILFVSHDLSSVEKFCDRALWLEKGTLMAEGYPREVVDRYLTYIEQEESDLYAIEHEKLKDCLETRENCPAGFNGDGFDPSSARENIKEKKRWGNGDVDIHLVRFTDGKNNEKYVFNTGEQLTIELHYRTKKIIEEPVFGVGIYQPNGTCVYGTNTYIENIELEKIEHDGIIRFHVPQLDLNESTYFLDVACHHKDGLPYDYHFRMYSIGVRSRIHNELGFYRPPHHWEHEEIPGNPLRLEMKHHERPTY